MCVCAHACVCVYKRERRRGRGEAERWGETSVTCPNISFNSSPESRQPVFGTPVIPEAGVRSQSEIFCSRGWLSTVALQLNQQRHTLSIFPSELLHREQVLEQVLRAWSHHDWSLMLQAQTHSHFHKCLSKKRMCRRRKLLSFCFLLFIFFCCKSIPRMVFWLPKHEKQRLILRLLVVKKHGFFKGRTNSFISMEIIFEEKVSAFFLRIFPPNRTDIWTRVIKIYLSKNSTIVSWFFHVSIWSYLKLVQFSNTETFFHETVVIHLSKLWFQIMIVNELIWKSESDSHSVVYNSATPWTVPCQAPPFMEFSRQEYCSGEPFPSLGNLPNPGIEPRSPTLKADSSPSEPPGKPLISKVYTKKTDGYSMTLSRYQIFLPYVLSDDKSPPTMQEIQVWSLGWGDPLEKGMATYCSILAWRISRTEEPGRL